MKNRLDAYRIFYETARCTSFSTAAEAMYISQSAISQSIRQLEESLNTQLFIRSRRGITLTREGELLFRKVEAAISALEQGETLLARLHHLSEGSLIIAAGDTITSQFLLPYLERFHATYPGIRIEMANSYSEDMLQRVREGKADLAFVNLPVIDEDLCIEPCLTVHDIFVCGPEEEKRESYSWAEIAEFPLILLEENSTSRNYVDRLFRDRGIHLQPQIEIAAYDLLIRFASIHLGVSCVIEEFTKKALDKGSVRKMNLHPPLPPRAIGCAYLREGALSSAAEAFLSLIREGSQPAKLRSTDIV